MSWFPKKEGRPRYFSLHFTSAIEKMSKISLCIAKWVFLLNWMLDLRKFTFCSVAFENLQIMECKIMASCLEARPHIKVSSTNRNRELDIEGEYLKSLMPIKFTDCLSGYIMQDKTCEMNKKRYGDKWSPWRSPRDREKQGEGSPLIRMVTNRCDTLHHTVNPTSRETKFKQS